MAASILQIQSALQFFHEFNLDLLLSFPNIWTLSHFRRIY